LQADPATNPGTTPTSSASLSLNIQMLFTAVNPNRVGIKYSESRFTVMYRGIPLGKASVPGFYQKAHSIRQVEATIAVDRVNLLQADAANLVGMLLSTTAWVYFKTHRLKIRHDPSKSASKLDSNAPKPVANASKYVFGFKSKT
jgi:hypothetical protein